MIPNSPSLWDGIAMPWNVIPPPSVPGDSGAFFNSPDRLREKWPDSGPVTDERLYALYYLAVDRNELS